MQIPLIVVLFAKSFVQAEATLVADQNSYDDVEFLPATTVRAARIMRIDSQMLLDRLLCRDTVRMLKETNFTSDSIWTR